MAPSKIAINTYSTTNNDYVTFNTHTGAGYIVILYTNQYNNLQITVGAYTISLSGSIGWVTGGSYSTEGSTSRAGNIIPFNNGITIKGRSSNSKANGVADIVEVTY